jgi:shikimate dehydrogenase
MKPYRYAVLGNPVAHSKSPFIHARFAAATGEAVEYGRVLCPMEGFVEAVRGFATGGENPGKGCNVTVPFKFEAPALARHVSPRAQQAGAANVLRFDADGWSADNTDGVGLVRDIERNAGVPLVGRRVLLVGAGGGGAGVMGPLLEAGVAELVIVNRTVAKARALAERHAALAARAGALLRVRALEEPGMAYDVVLNASATSLQGQASPVPASTLAPGALALDLMYGPAATPFLAWAAAAGAVPRDGLGMLVEQAAEAFFFWRGVRPATAPVLQALREEMEAAR